MGRFLVQTMFSGILKRKHFEINFGLIIFYLPLTIQTNSFCVVNESLVKYNSRSIEIVSNTLQDI